MKTNRRNFFQTMGAGAAGLGLVSANPLIACASSNQSNEDDDGQVLFMGDDIAIADTKYGKVQGFIIREVYTFRGIPYGADTSGKNRFMPPQPPESWDGIFPALWWGNTAPQIVTNKYAKSYWSFAEHWNVDDISEDCLRLNVWTKGVTDGRKRPVLVWYHGGGYTSGNAIELDSFKGENLSRKEDVVFVSVNHRLGPIGFSDLSSVGGKKYADSGNVGALDMVAALEWVNENIANFGGDPDNVTIMGQSGGGGKVCTIAAMPRAKGLIHKMVPLSGSAIQAGDQSISQKIGEYILKEAGLKPSQIDKLQEMPWEDYIRLANSAARKMREEQGNVGMRGGFRPVADGRNIPTGKFYMEPDGLFSDVPMLICSTFHEWNLNRTEPELENISADEAKKILKERGRMRGGLNEKADEIYDAYAKTFPGMKPIEIIALVNSSRKHVVETADAKCHQKAPVYTAWFGWEPNLFSNRMRAFHCLDINFWFANTDLMLTHTGGGKRPRTLANKMSSALVQFMKTGNPNGGGLPAWPKYTPEVGEVMVLNDVSEVQNDPDREARKAL